MMLSYEEGLDQVLKSTTFIGHELVTVSDAGGRFLSENPTSQVDLPPFVTSSVDGYAITLPTNGHLSVAIELPAGATALPPLIKPDTAAQVFTGSPLPSNSSAVVMIEDTARDGDRLVLSSIPAQGENLRLQGEEMSVGQPLARSGQIVDPPMLALLANSGNAVLQVAKRPKVAIVEIGSELQSPGQALRPGAIYAANGIALSEACEALGAETSLFRSGDDYGEMDKKLDAALEYGDVVLTSGGVSVGKHDHVKAIWESRGVQEIFWRAAIRPGKPIFFGVKDGKTIFGLPGNPVSTLVTFFLFARPALLKCQGSSVPPWIKLRSAKELLSAPNVDIFLRVKVEDGVAFPLSHQGSHMLSGLAHSDALLRIPRGLGRIAVGSTLKALPLNWNS